MTMSPEKTPPEGILLVDKPKGITSFDVIRKLRQQRGVRKMGHAGTLDPLASGLMIIGVGAGTKKLTEYIKLEKTYEAEIILGERRTTGDLEGDIVAQCDMRTLDITEAVVRDALTGMVGTLELPVPAYSAVKRGGEALYKKARRGEQVETPLKLMRVNEATLTKLENKGTRIHVHVTFSVGSGTYIRSLAEELGRRLPVPLVRKPDSTQAGGGVPATLANLRRTRIGEFTLAHTLTPILTTLSTT